MAVIPLGTDDIESRDENAPRIRMENMYLIDSPYSPDKVSRVSRPTLTTVIDFATGPIYGFFREDGVFDGDWFVVSGTALYRHKVGTTPTHLGNIPGTGFCEFIGGGSATSGTTLVLILRDGVVFRYDGGGLSQIVLPDSQLVGSISYMDGFFILSVQDSEKFYWIAPGLINPDPLDFASAERIPDAIVSISVIGDELWFLGQSSIEVWTAGTDPDAPFQRVIGRAYTYGCATVDSVVQSNSQGYPALLWVTDSRIVVMAQGSPNKVSNDSVDEILRDATNIRAWGFQYNRHNFYILTCDQATLAYDLTKGTWSRWSSHLLKYWRAHLGIQQGSVVYGGDATTGLVYKLEEGTSDNGDPVQRVTSGVVTTSANFQPCNRVNVMMNAGWTASYGPSAILEMRWSDDLGSSWGDYVQMPIGEKGRYGYDVTYSGLGMIRRPGRMFEFRFSDFGRFRLDYATMNES